MIKLSIPGREFSAELNNLILDPSGILTPEPGLGEGVKNRIEALKDRLEIYLVASDPEGSEFELAETLGVNYFKVGDIEGAQDKLDLLNTIVPEETVVIGNGYSDTLVFEEAALAIVVIGQQGCSVQALKKADIAVNDVEEALDLLLKPQRIVATLRG